MSVEEAYGQDTTGIAVIRNFANSLDRSDQMMALDEIDRLRKAGGNDREIVSLKRQVSLFPALLLVHDGT
jgi:hypothetical protein